jgi:hypothetical protein
MDKVKFYDRAPGAVRAIVVFLAGGLNNQVQHLSGRVL